MRIIPLFFCFILTSCLATTRLSGVVDPDYRGSFLAQKIAVVGKGLSIEEQIALENTLLETLAMYDVLILRGLEIFPPTREYSENDTFDILLKNGADTILIVNANNRGVSETYVPPVYHPGSSTSYVTGYGNFARIETYTSSGYTTGGYNLSEPEMGITVQLVNSRNRKTIWIAEGYSNGLDGVSFKDLTISAGRTISDELYKAGLIARK